MKQRIWGHGTYGNSNGNGATSRHIEYIEGQQVQRFVAIFVIILAYT